MWSLGFQPTLLVTIRNFYFPPDTYDTPSCFFAALLGALVKKAKISRIYFVVLEKKCNFGD